MSNSKRNARSRGVMSFLLFVFIFLLNTAICAKCVFVNPEFIKSSFVDYDYVSGYCEDINCYARDLFFKDGLACDKVGDILSYDFCYTLTEKYIGAQLGNDSGYVEATVQSTIDEVRQPLASLIESEASAASKKYSAEVGEKAADEICNYITERMSITGMEKLKAVLNAGSVASLVAIAGTGMFTLAFCLITFFIGSTRYRSLRAISIPFLSVGILDICLSLMSIVILHFKSIDIYPLYLRGALMSCIYGGVQSFILFGAGCIIISLILSTIVWKMKRVSK